MDDISIQIFQIVSREGSLRRAARLLYITEPAISARIRSLEKDLDTQLFIRGARGIELTDEGEVFNQWATQYLKFCQQIRITLKQDRQLSSNITIGSTPSFASYRLAPVLSEFTMHHDKFSVQIETDSPDRVVQGVVSGQYQLGVLSTISFSNGVLKSLLLGTEPIVLITSYLTSDINPPCSPSALANLRILCPGLNYGSWEQIKQYLSRNQIRPRQIIHVNNRETIKRTVALTPGLYGFVPRDTLQMDGSMAARIHEVSLIDNEGLFIPIQLIWRRGYLTEEVRKCLSVIRKAVSSH